MTYKIWLQLVTDYIIRDQIKRQILHQKSSFLTVNKILIKGSQNKQTFFQLKYTVKLGYSEQLWAAIFVCYNRVDLYCKMTICD